VEPSPPSRPRGWKVVRKFSYGGTAAIVTSVGLIVGFNAAAAQKGTLVGGLLIIAIADNLTDSLSIHVYQESELLPGRTAFTETVTNFAARLGLALSFVLLVALASLTVAAIVSVVWGLLLLVTLTSLVAKERGVNVLPELGKHVVVACAVIVVSVVIGSLVPK